MTEPDTVIELIFQNFGLQFKKKNIVSLLSTAIFPEASGIAMATECRPRAWPHRQWLQLMEFGDFPLVNVIRGRAVRFSFVEGRGGRKGQEK